MEPWELGRSPAPLPCRRRRWPCCTLAACQGAPLRQRTAPSLPLAGGRTSLKRCLGISIPRRASVLRTRTRAAPQQCAEVRASVCVCVLGSRVASSLWSGRFGGRSSQSRWPVIYDSEVKSPGPQLAVCFSTSVLPTRSLSHRGLEPHPESSTDCRSQPPVLLPAAPCAAPQLSPRKTTEEPGGGQRVGAEGWLHPQRRFPDCGLELRLRMEVFLWGQQTQAHGFSF